jgi:hypothetical protein
LSAVASIESLHRTELSAEESSRIAADSVEASTRASADASIDTRVSSEESTRLSADSSLDVKFSTADSTEASVRASADASIEVKMSEDISSEASSRVSADASLDSKLSAADSVEASTRLSADASLEVALSSQISAEASSRIAADSSLDTRVNDIISNTDVTAIDSFTEVIDEINSVTESNFDSIYAKKVGISPATDGTTTSFTLASAVKADSEQIYLNGLLQNSDDYSISGTGISFNSAPESGSTITAYGVYGTFTDIA